MADLRDCPFCGCRATFVKHSAGMPNTQGFDSWHAVACKHCRATVGACDRRFRNHDDAAEVWNRRTPSPASHEQVEALLRVAPHFPGGETPEPSLSALIYRYYRLYFDQPKADDFAKQYLAALHHQPSAQMQGESE